LTQRVLVAANEKTTSAAFCENGIQAKKHASNNKHSQLLHSRVHMCVFAAHSISGKLALLFVWLTNSSTKVQSGVHFTTTLQEIVRKVKQSFQLS
jgi:hypothetical protein